MNKRKDCELTEEEMKELNEIAKPLTTVIFFDGYIRALEDLGRALLLTIKDTGKNTLPIDLIAGKLIPCQIETAKIKRDELLKETGNEYIGPDVRSKMYN